MLSGIPGTGGEMKVQREPQKGEGMTILDCECGRTWRLERGVVTPAIPRAAKPADDAQALRSAVIEECAKHIETYSVSHWDRYGGWSGPSDDAEILASALRALATQPKEKES